MTLKGSFAVGTESRIMIFGMRVPLEDLTVTVLLHGVEEALAANAKEDVVALSTVCENRTRRLLSAPREQVNVS